MNNTTAYTPLECLLLFQSLATYGTDDNAFARTSELLTNNALVKDGDTYNAARMTPDALRDIYLLLLREELKAEDRDGQEDGGQAASKKRKLQTPPPPTIKDAQNQKEKMPQFVDKLYARYCDYMIRAIRDDERRYASLKQEIIEIERGDWDERILEEDRAFANRTADASKDRLSPKLNGTTTAEAGPQADVPEATEQAQVQKVAAVSTIAQSPLALSSLPPPPGQILLQQPLRNGSPAVAPPASQRSGGLPPPNPQYYSEPNQAGMQPGIAYKWEPPYQAGPQQVPPYQTVPNYGQLNGLPYPPPPYPPPPSPRDTLPHPHGMVPLHPHLPPSPINNQHASTQQPHSASQPVTHGSQPSPGSLGMPLPDMGGQKYRPSSASPMPQQPHPSHYGYPPPTPRPLSGAGPPPPHWNQQHAPPYSPQQFQYPPVPSHRTPFVPPPNMIQPESRQYNSPYNAHQGSRPPLNQPQSSQTPTITSRPSYPTTPSSQALPRLMTGTGTRWTPTALGATPKSHTVTAHPVVEPLSPVTRPADPHKTVRKVGRPPKKQNQKTQSPAKPTVPVQGRGSRRTRAGSTASSIIAGSCRSQSVLSQTDELSMDNEFASRPMKQEVGTPLGLEDVGDTTADDFSGRAYASPRRGPKRKRQDSILSPFSPKPSVPPTHVLWTRNFPKMSASALESITGHRTASTFAAPVKERDAPGYRHLILRPQDLSSIRKAINAGHRAGAAAAPPDLHPSQSSIWLPISEDLIPPKGIVNYAQFEKELMRMFANAIMFNADPDRGVGRRWDVARDGKVDVLGYAIEEDGVVKDTRAMLGDVEGLLRNLRSAIDGKSEFAGGLNSSVGPPTAGLRFGSSVMADDDDVDELAGDGEPHIGPAVGSLAKRRKRI